MEFEQQKERIKEHFCQTSDLEIKEFTTQNNQSVLLVFLANIIDQLLLTSSVIAPLQDLPSPSEDNTDIADLAMEKIISFSQVSVAQDFDTMAQQVLNGFCAVYFANSDKVLIVECAKWIVRTPTEPPTSAVVKGPREGFVEDFVTNITLIRKRLKTPKLKIDEMVIGRKTNSQVRIIYLSDTADPKVVNAIKAKLQKIDIDGIVDSNYLAEFLQTGNHVIFKQVGTTEKPDVAVAKILEGRVAILVDGSPIVLTLPYILLEDLQSSNDYYTNPARATFLRYLRLFSGVIAIMLPGLYVALLCHHAKAIPIKLLITITNSIQGIPIPPLLETLFIIFLFEILYEASLRMPRHMGLALSIVGALILGDTAVKAGLISPPAVLIVALTGVMNYTIPELSNQTSFLRLVFTIIGGFMGILGIVLGGLFLIAYLANMDSYGSPYLSPFAPNNPTDKKDGLVRQNIPQMGLRPKSIKNINKRRQKNDRTDY